jgi:hypothetical protein
MRLLILSCSATKRLDAHSLPAVERYDGPAYRLTRKYVRECPAQRQCLDILIVSAEFGLLTGDALIPLYDRRMDAQRASALRPLLQQQMVSLLADRPAYAATCTNLANCMPVRWCGTKSHPAAAMPDLARLRISMGRSGSACTSSNAGSRSPMRPKHPPEFGTHRVSECTVWELLEREGLLDLAYFERSAGLPRRVRTRRERERGLLEHTQLAGYTPPRPSRRSSPDLWLYLTTRRSVHYRLAPDGAVQVWTRTPPLRGVSGGGRSWQPTFGARTRWLAAVSAALLLRHLRATAVSESVARVENAALAPAPDQATHTVSLTSAIATYHQLLLFD